MRSLRQSLGSKQRRLVMDSFPFWIDVVQTPLGIEEARALARLFTTLTTKTVVRTHGHQQAGTTLKAESLSKPFSRHAVYVLTAYFEAMSDPLCVLSADIRHELQPGLYALCEMTSEHMRDAAMTSALDANGKATFKALWRDYEKQRYIGRG